MEVTEIYDSVPRNTVRIVIGDCNAKIGRKTMFRLINGEYLTISLHSAQEQNNDSSQKVA